MKYIAFDIGDKRIGVAVSDPFGEFALPLETYYRKNFNKDLEYLVKLATDRYADVIVCGLPLNFDGSKSEQTLKTESFIEELKKNKVLSNKSNKYSSKPISVFFLVLQFWVFQILYF